MKTEIRSAKTRSALLSAAALGAFLGLAAPMGVALAAGQDLRPVQAPDATFVIYGERNDGPGTFSGDGVVTYQGQQQPFTVHGLTVQGTTTNRQVEGAVYNLADLKDLPGHYTLIEHELQGNKEVIWLRNEKGVEVTTTGPNEGMVLALKAAGITVAAEK